MANFSFLLKWFLESGTVCVVLGRFSSNKIININIMPCIIIYSMGACVFELGGVRPVICIATHDTRRGHVEVHVYHGLGGGKFHRSRPAAFSNFRTFCLFLQGHLSYGKSERLNVRQTVQMSELLNMARGRHIIGCV